MSYDAAVFVGEDVVTVKLWCMDQPDWMTLRAALNVSQDALAQLLGVSVSTLRRWERGDRLPIGGRAHYIIPWTEIREAQRRGHGARHAVTA